jgi:hypothetical protein
LRLSCTITPQQLFQVQEFDDYPEQQIDFLQDLGFKEIDLLFHKGAYEIEVHNGQYGSASCNGKPYWWKLPKATYDLWRILNG